ncbi:mRNA splicing protein [Mortierella alpina]|uniref:Pre-mRNA-processing protein 45 n=1 Tax=Mortierella alpina TaxID=64518 RepID=A0A9P6M2Y2_MORAP|nr:mRNA splicing protein [Mortierella alpina]
MSSLSGLLPAPVHQHPGQDYDQQQYSGTGTAPVARIPPYGQRSGWKPKKPEDFGDGGAFPEIHTAQYPLDMGRKKKSTTKAGSTIALQVDAQGNVAYDAIAKRGHSSKQIVQSQFKDLVPLNERADVGEISLSRPSEEEVQETAERTRAALEKISKTKITAAQPKSVVSNNKPGAPTYIRYTPANQSASAEGVNQRVIRMVEMPVDPMEPPKHHHKKVPRGPPSPPPPVLHSPPRKVTAKEQADWVIPPCISNWKNAKGYTIPLDKRLAADGRGLQEVHINDNFAKLSEALALASRHAQDEVRQRGLMQQKVAQKEKEAKEQNLRALAQRARDERAGIVSSSAPADQDKKAHVESGSDESGSEDEEDEAKQRAARERDALRKERAQEREKDLRMSRMGAEQKAKVMAKSEGRDISEKIALGLAKPTQSKDSMYDSRLFNQSQGLDSGFKDDEAYSVYDKAMFTHTGSSVYRPKRAGGDAGNDEVGTEDDINRALASERFGSAGLGGSARGFSGTEGGRDMKRDGPVAFEKEADIFGLDEFNKDVSKKRTGLDLSSKQEGKRRKE